MTQSHMGVVHPVGEPAAGRRMPPVQWSSAPPLIENPFCIAGQRLDPESVTTLRSRATMCTSVYVGVRRQNDLASKAAWTATENCLLVKAVSILNCFDDPQVAVDRTSVF